MDAGYSILATGYVLGFNMPRCTDTEKRDFVNYQEGSKEVARRVDEAEILLR